MSSLHWTRGSFNIDSFGPLPIGPNVIDLNIPAGATLKKFVVCNTMCQGWIQGNDYRSTTPIHITQTVTFTTGHYAGRILWEQIQMPEQSSSAFINAVTGNQFYQMYFNGGDTIFGINAKCSYGDLSTPAMNLEYSATIAAQGWGVSSTQRIEFYSTFKALFQTTP